MNPDLPTCTVETCDRPTQMYLCSECITELQGAWDAIPALLPVLQLIVRGEEQAFRLPTAGGRGASMGSKPPINLSALSLVQDLQLALACTPAQYGQQSDGWRAKLQIEKWVADAERMVHGEKEDRPEEQYSKLKVKIMPVLSPAEMVEWFASEEGPGVDITEDQLKNWKHRGRLHRHNKDGRPKYHAADVYLAYQNQGVTGWRPASDHGNQAYPESNQKKEAECTPKT